MPIMEALSTKQSKVIYSPKYKFKNPLYLWALKSAFSSPGLASAVIAMAISFTVFIGGLFIAGAIRDEYKSYMQSDYHISYNNTLCGGDLMIPIDIQGGMSSEDISYLRSNNDIKQVWSVKTIPVNILLEKATQESLLIGTLADRELKDADASKIKYGYHKDDRLFKSYITGVDDDLLQALNKFLVQGSINLEKLRTGEEVIICTKLEDIPCKLGDKITLTQLIVDRELPRYSLEGAVKVTKKATIGGIVKLPVGFNKFTNIFYNDTNVLWGNDAFKALKIDSNYTNVYIDLKDVNIFKGVEDILKILKESHPTGLSFDSRREQNIKQKEVVTIVYIFTYSISIIVGCMAILNIVNHVIYRIRVRKRELGMLRAIGLTKKQMTKILQIELVSIVLTSIIIGVLLLTTLFVYIAMTSSMDYIKFIPFKEVILTIIVLLIIPILTIRFLVNSFYKKSVVEQIKWVE